MTIQHIYHIIRLNRTIKYIFTPALKPRKEHIILELPPNTFGGLLDIRRLINITDKNQYDKIIIKNNESGSMKYTYSYR